MYIYIIYKSELYLESEYIFVCIYVYTHKYIFKDSGG